MSSPIVTIADAVVTELNATHFSKTFTAARLYLPQFNLADMTTLHVSVVPKGVAYGEYSRASMLGQYQIDVAIQQKTTGADTEADALLALVDEITGHFVNLRLDCGAACVKIENDPIYDPEHMRENNLFTSLLTLTFSAERG